MATMRQPTNPLPDPDVPSAAKHLHCSLQGQAQVLDADYWRQLCPALHVDDEALQKRSKPLSLSKVENGHIRRQVDTEGVAQIEADKLSVDAGKLARAVVQLMQHGWPATFAIMFDEVWELIHRMSKTMEATTGNACNMDILLWYVDPNKGHAGFSPHRDRQPPDAAATFRPDGSAMYSTCWVALTDAVPDNSCLYVLPRHADPGYVDGDLEGDDDPDPLQRALASKEAYQLIRALPAPAGSAVLFTHRIIHWGSRGRRGYPTPRVAVSWGCAADGFEPPYFSREKHLPFPPLRLRAALACGQMIAYHERFAMTPKQLSMFYRIFKAQAADFDAAYRRKITAEFVAASRDVTARDETAAAAGGSGGGSGASGSKQDATAAGAPAGGKRKAAALAVAEAEAAGAAAGPSSSSGATKSAASVTKRAKGDAADAAAVKEESAKSTGKGAAGGKAGVAAAAAASNRKASGNKSAGAQAAASKQKSKKATEEEDDVEDDDDDDDEGWDVGSGDGGGGSDVLDEALDEMLMAKMDGHDDFEDDFDDGDMAGEEQEEEEEDDE